MKNLIPKTFKKDEIGKKIKSTKISYTWEFSYNKKEYILNLKDSHLTGKLRIELNNNEIFKDNYNLFKKKINHDLYIDNLDLKIIKNNNKINLQINGINFEDLFATQHYKNENLKITKSYVKNMNEVNNKLNFNINNSSIQSRFDEKFKIPESCLLSKETVKTTNIMNKNDNNNILNYNYQKD